MNYNIPPKQTLYNGIKFRSKLEAQWAAFFDLLEWEYSYEPYELNGKVPDFIIKCDSPNYGTKNLIVEVKPDIFISPQYQSEIYNAYELAKTHILIVSEKPIYECNEMQGWAAIGIGSQYYDSINERSEMHDLSWKCGLKAFDIGSIYMSYDSMIYRDCNRKGFFQFTQDYESIEQIKKLWKEAGNIIQFKTYTK